MDEKLIACSMLETISSVVAVWIVQWNKTKWRWFFLQNKILGAALERVGIF